MIKVKISFPFLVFFISLTIGMNAFGIDSIVKLSSSGICHDNSSRSYNKTKKYTAYKSINECLKAGGRLPKSTTKKVDEATKEAIDQGRDFVYLYDRSDWPHWVDSDRDCQNTRHELLISRSSIAVSFKSDEKCNVSLGSWYDPYSGATFTSSKELDLDHIVPLKFAHGHGGDKWSKELKQEFANDMANLELVDASLNRQKGAKGIDEWLPPNFYYRCTYIAEFDAVMNKYGLSYIPSEKRIVERLKAACRN
ncbi:GmrSD restriction endonuclease domain-containing protein [Aliiglaciecola aliphaticivorans]